MSLEYPTFPPNLADPNACFVNASCIDLLLIELVPMAFRLADEFTAQPHTPGSETDEDEHKDIVQGRLDSLGYRVGQGLVERSASNSCIDNGILTAYILSFAGFLGIGPGLSMLWTLSNSSARTYGLWFSASKLIT